MTDINDEVRASLLEAGIGKRYHDVSLVSVPVYGEALMRLLTTRGQEARQGTLNLAWHGVGLTESIIMFSRALHINGVGCLVRPLVRMRPIINDLEFKEQVNEIDVLVILNAQDTVRDNPLHPSVMAELEYLLRKRFDNDKATFLQFAIPEDMIPGEVPNRYWSDEFIELVQHNFSPVTPTQLKKVTPIK